MTSASAPAAFAAATLPPGPSESPDDQARRWMEDPCTLLDTCRADYGDLFTLRLGAFGTIVIVASPEGVGEVLATGADGYECRHFNNSYRYAMGDQALFLQDGADHRQLKAMLAPAFLPRNLQAHAETVRRIVAETMDSWSRGATMLLRPAMHEITLAGLLALTLGDRLALRTEIAGWFRNSVWRDLRSWKPWTAMSRLRPQICALLASELDRLRAAPTGNAVPTLLETLLQARDERGALFGDDVIQDQITMLMITAGDVVGVAASWALYRAARHGEAQARLRDERDADDGARPAAELLRRPYLVATIREVLRLHPILPTVSGRKLTAPFAFMGYDLPAGVTLAPCQYLVHRRGDIYAEPLSFQPERFVGRNYPLPAYFPFGGSERACLGGWLAPMSIAIIVDTILSRFTLATVDGAEPRTVRHGTLLAPAPDLAVRFS